MTLSTPGPSKEFGLSSDAVGYAFNPSMTAQKQRRSSPVLGHLEVLESYKRVIRSRNAVGRVTWSVA